MQSLHTIHKLALAGALTIAGAAVPASPRPIHAAVPTARPDAHAAVVSIDGVGLIPAGTTAYSKVLRLGQTGAFVALYHSSYKGTLKAHVSVDRNSRTIYREMMKDAGKKTHYFYVWSQFRNRKQLGRLVAYLTIQAGSARFIKALPFTLAP